MWTKYDSSSDAYLAVLREVMAGEECAPRGLLVREVRDLGFEVVNPEYGAVTTRDPARDEVMKKYLHKEMELYKDGARTVDRWSKVSKFWERIANPDGTINSAYGWLIWANSSCGNWMFTPGMETPWQWALRCLQEDKDTRQAFLRFSLPEHQWRGCRDQVCTMHMNFLIRDDKLHATVVMRSQDVVKGLPYDMPFFMYLQKHMRNELVGRYPDLRVGTYRHLSHSMHMYLFDTLTVQKMLGRPYEENDDVS